MTLTAVFGDVHASKEALQAILVDCKKRRVNRYVCLGDIVGLGPDPAECVKLIKNYCGKYTLEGNHDYYFKHYASGLTRDGPSKESDTWTKINWFDPNELRKQKDLALGHSLKSLLEDRLKKYAPTTREGLEEYTALFRLADQEEYFDFLENLKPELPNLRRENLEVKNLIKEEKELVKKQRRYTPNLELENLSEEEKELVKNERAKRIEKLRQDIPNLGLENLPKEEKELVEKLELSKEEIELLKEKIIFSHGFPSIMFEYANKLRVDADKDVYVVTGNQWRDKALKYKDEAPPKERFAIAEEVIKYLSEGFTLFEGHSHMPFEVVDMKKNCRVINTGAVFDARNPRNDIASYSLYDSEAPIDETTIRRVKYNRAKTNAKIIGLGVIERYVERYAIGSL
ncbi:metallophosphoesterase [Candidatus Woesearchaeota archaeon]|nr:metallophosphoesterase [Candidatus Woesearchaeota archaeon]